MAEQTTGSKPSKLSGPQSVARFLETLDHPLKQEVVALRQIILDADPQISEAIKWNAPSFCTVEHFATMHLRAKDAISVILHLGAKKRDAPTSMTIADPEGLLTWLGPERASVTFHDLRELAARRPAFEQIIRQWLPYV